MSIVLTRTRMTGRHRLGLPGLIPVSALATVVRRGIFRSLFWPAKHRHNAASAAATRRVGVRATAAA